MFEYINIKILTYNDCFSKKVCVIIVNYERAENIIKALNYALKFLGKIKVYDQIIIKIY